MKTKKITVNWPSVLLGMVLCMVLVVFLGARQVGGADAQTGIVQKKTVHSEGQTGIAQKTVTLEDVMAKCELIDQRVLILEGKIDHLKYLSDDILRNVVQLNQKVK